MLSPGPRRLRRWGYLTIVDGILIPAWFLRPLREALEAAGHQVAYAVLRAPLEACIERAEKREGPFLADPEVIRQLWQSFADLADLEPNAIELGDESPEEVADIVQARLEAGALGSEPRPVYSTPASLPSRLPGGRGPNRSTCTCRVSGP